MTETAAEYPSPEQIIPEIHEATYNPQIWIVPSLRPQVGLNVSQFRNNRVSPAPVYRQVFLCRRVNPCQAYQIIQPPAFQPVELSHGGPTWGYLFMGVVIPRRTEDLIYEEPTEEEAQRVAIKRLNISIVSGELQNGSRENPYKEIFRMQTIGDHHHICSIIEALQDENYLYIITPWCDGGSLSDNIPLAPNDQYSIEEQARIIFQQILEGLDYLHREHRICHRDIKPSNFLVSGSGRVLIGDLAMSFVMPEGGIVKHIGRFGTPPFMVPEIAMGRSFDGAKCDFWAAVVTLYSLVTGLPYLYRFPQPDDILFRYTIMARGLSRDRHNELVREIIEELNNVDDIYAFNTAMQRIQNLPYDLLELFENALSLIPEQRWGVEEASRCRWMHNGET
mmetsp:Transcript_110523/g.226099  ORF Transcript_110523/g.226099 Transcript_110523/m.226099 type:complete len:393 (-) Transcript_110523:49-1227(-)|eukprot:CAMPEP_0201204526 /NCGR_PEP_ID=MMETSP0851-20130426/169064_1 /ASSEMBLY_ACC=CAM_ASM_000631 /TAXON_ID=183588 /ORGANISM="Pseudo-nitzschia fraudulenta, Strain WWA7" /LENGTH=392 /DNA_ID=CAMNT_0047492645 /DNA_START=234 /DNA_END=1412 /DNA_ORIENTATION=+